MKRNTILTTAALFAAALFILDNPAAYAGTYYFHAGGGSGNWSDGSKWYQTACNSGSTGTVPGAGDRAVICAGQTCNVDIAVDESNPFGAVADTIDVQGTLNIQDGKTLTLDNNNDNVAATPDGSVVAGTLNLQYTSSASELAFITSDHTLTGAGSIVGANHATLITLGSNSLDLESQITIAGALQITESGTPTTTSFKNGSGGCVDADTSGTLEIVTVDSIAAGSGEWKVTASGANLKFSVAATGESGAFTVSAGTLDIDQNVTTTGDLTFTGGTIDVASGKTYQAS